MFPVRVPYTIGPNMSRNSGKIFNKVPDPDYILAKGHELSTHGDDLYASTQEADINRLIRKASRFCGVPETDNIVDLGLCLEEDIAIIYNGILSAICFCFPSGWIPKQRIGLPLSDIHQPIADSKRLVQSSPHIAETMADVTQGSFCRSVWTITNNNNLSQHPDRKCLKVPYSIDDLYFRTEYQTTAPLGDNITSLFFVKVTMEPLRNIWNDSIKQQLIINSVNSMSDAVLEYKNLQHIKTLLNNNE